jgi:hypothetical protein
MTFVTRKRFSFHVILPADTSSLLREVDMPIARNQRPTTIDVDHHRRYQAISDTTSKLISMASMRRAAHNLYLDTLDIRHRVLAKYRSQGIYLSEVELVRKLLYAEFYREALTIVTTTVDTTDDYSNAG